MNRQTRVLREALSRATLVATATAATVCFLLMAGLQSIAAERILHFPQKSVGTLKMLLPSTYPDYLAYGEIDSTNLYGARIDARGEVKIPAEKQAMLLINYTGLQDLSFLKAFQPGEITGLSFGSDWQGLGFRDEDVAKIPKALAVKGLDFKRNEISDVGITDIAKIKTLQCLKLPHTSIRGKTIAALSSLPDLHSLDLSANQMAGTDWSWLGKCKKLTRLQVPKCGVVDGDMQNILQPQLTFLIISQNRITDKGLEKLPTMTKLTDLEVSECPISHATFARMAKLPHLRKLYANGCSITAEDLKVLSNLKTLTNLAMAGAEVNDAIVEELGGMKALQNLSATINSIQEKRLHKLLPHCSIASTKLKSAGMKHREALDFFGSDGK